METYTLLPIESSLWPVPAGKGMALPRRITATLQRSDGFVFEMVIGVRGAGPICTQLTIRHRQEGRRVTAAAIRGFPLDQFVALAAVQTAMKVQLADAGNPKAGSTIAPVRPGPEMDAAIARFMGPTRQPVTDELLEEVARIYREAFERGEPPTKAVQEHFGKTRTTASRWLKAAHERGFLGPRQERQAGETRKARTTKGGKR